MRKFTLVNEQFMHFALQIIAWISLLRTLPLCYAIIRPGSGHVDRQRFTHGDRYTRSCRRFGQRRSYTHSKMQVSFNFVSRSSENLLRRIVGQSVARFFGDAARRLDFRL